MNKITVARWMGAVLSCFLIITSNHAAAQDRQPPAQSVADLFKGSNENSKSDLDYRPLDRILKGIVFVVGRSNRQAAPEISLPTGTRISPANPERTRFEGNRVFFHLIEEAGLQEITDFRSDLAAIPSWIDMSRLSKNAQLAYWLNLYNITLIEQIALRYPITDTERLRREGLWEEKLLTINGVAISLNDIQYKILSNWNDPKVIYGLFQGAVGGPNMRDHAFRASGVQSALTDNARDFVNSLRGVQFWGNTAKISDFYRRVADKFPGDINYLRSHMMQYAEGAVSQSLNSASSIEYGDYDYHIADLYNGVLGGNSINDNAAASINMNATAIRGAADGEHSGRRGPEVYLTSTNVGASDTFGTDMVGRSGNLPPHAIELLTEIVIRNRERRTNISIEDVNSDEETVIKEEGGGQ